MQKQTVKACKNVLFLLFMFIFFMIELKKCTVKIIFTNYPSFMTYFANTGMHKPLIPIAIGVSILQKFSPVTSCSTKRVHVRGICYIISFIS